MSERDRTNQRRGVALALSVLALALITRLAFISATHDQPNFRTPTPGLDIALTWEAALDLRAATGVDESAHLEMKALSAPLYPYWLALHQALFGESMTVQRCVYAVYNSLRYFLLFFIVARIGRKTWPALVVTAGLCALPSLLYFDTVLLKAGLDLTLLTVLLYVSLAFAESDATSRFRPLWGLVLAAVLVACFLSQLATFLYAIPVGAFVLLSNGDRWKRVVTCAACVVPAAVVVLAVEGRSISADSNFLPRSGVDLRIGLGEGAPGAKGLYRQLPDIAPSPAGHAFESRLAASLAEGRVLSPTQAEHHHRNQAFEHVLAEPFSTLALVAGKTAWFFRDYEVKGNDYLYALKERTPSLRWAPVHFGHLLVFAVLGMIALVSTRRTALLILLGGITGCILAANVLTVVNWRFRLPAVIPLSILAGIGLPFAWARVAQVFESRGRDRVAIYRSIAVGGLLVGLGLFTFWPVSHALHDDAMQRVRTNEALSLDAEARLERGVDSLSPEQRAEEYMELHLYSRAFAALCEARDTGGKGGRPNSHFATATAGFHYLQLLLWQGKNETAAEYIGELKQTNPELLNAVLRTGQGNSAEFARRFLLSP